jgi:hypothetical protein
VQPDAQRRDVLAQFVVQFPRNPATLLFRDRDEALEPVAGVAG